MTEYTHDVFVSHSKADLPWVREELLPRLEGAGLRVLLSDRDFELGAPEQVNVERAVEDSRHTLIVLTPEWLAGEWTEFEGLLVGAADPAGRRRKLIPLMLRPCNLPPRIAVLTHTDFTNVQDRRWQWERLISALKDDRRAAKQRAAERRSSAPYPSVPIRDQIFVNRDRELDLLNVERLRTSPSPYTLIDAPAGYGKTCLLRQVLRVVQAAGEAGARWSLRYVEFHRRAAVAGEADMVAPIVAALAGEAEPGLPEALLDRTCTYVVQELTAPLAEGRRAVLILLDGVEQLDERARQWLYQLLRDCYERARSPMQELVVVRFVLSGQNVDRFWEGYAPVCPSPHPPQRIALDPLDLHAIQEWVWKQAQAAHIGLDQDAVRQIAGHVSYLSGGHPRVIHGLVDDLADRLFMIGSADLYYQEQRQNLLRDYLAPVADELLVEVQDGVQEAVQTLSVFRRVNANTVQALERAGALQVTDEIALLGDLQRARVLEQPRIDEPFYRDRLLRPVLALDMAHRSEASRSRFLDLNRVALDMYAGWVQDGEQALSASHLKATQRLYAVVEWLYHALHEESMGEHELRAGLQAHIAALAQGDNPDAVARLIVDALDRDQEVRYLLCSRFGEGGMETAREWLVPTQPAK